MSPAFPRPLLISFVALVVFFGLADLFTTSLDFIFAHGFEANPIAAYAYAHGGLLALWALKVIVLSVAYAYAVFCLRLQDSFLITLLTWVFFAFAILFALISFSNLLGLLIGQDLFHFFLGVLILFLLSH